MLSLQTCSASETAALASIGPTDKECNIPSINCSATTKHIADFSLRHVLSYRA